MHKINYKKLNLKNDKDYIDFIIGLYNKGLSSKEIVDYIYNKINESITSRSIQRLIVKYGSIRSVKEAYNNAIKRGRVQWAYKNNKIKRRKLNPKLRYKILQRDGFKCVLCGNTALNTTLEVDHIVKVENGGQNIEDNLRTLCHECNLGRG